MPARSLAILERLRLQFGDPGAIQQKLEALRALEHARLRTAEQVIRFHEALCFIRAYPDDDTILRRVERLLKNFAARIDLRAHAAALENSGIAGTATRYAFFWPTARWLAQEWPNAMTLDRSDTVAGERILRQLPLIVSGAEAVWVKERGTDGFAALDTLRPGRVTDATFLLRQMEELPGNAITREAFHDGIEPTYLLSPTPASPARTHAVHRVGPIVFQRTALERTRPDLRAEFARPPVSVRAVTPQRGAQIVALARAAMVTRERDLDAFAYGDPRDVRIVHDYDGLSFALNGVQPDRRLLLPAVFGALTLRNGVPIGYVQIDLLDRTAALSFNTFPTFRGGEAALALARTIALTHHLFGATSFSLEPYQLGKGNDEGIASGAWWFYYKLGFRPYHIEPQRIARDELARMRVNRRHRSSPLILERLAEHPLFLNFDPRRPRGIPPIAELGLHVSKRLTQMRAADPGKSAELPEMAAKRIGLRSFSGFSASERWAWGRWSALLLSLDGLERWTAGEKRQLIEIVRAKGGRSEIEYLRRFDKHPRLGKALLGRY
ncbi:MAG: hypothetical protein ACKVQT_09960 [Burkholderiales bacterium]